MIRTWLIITGNMVTSFGNSMYVVALLIFFTDGYPRPMNIGSIQAAAYLPIVLFSVLGGRIADRRDRTQIIAGTDFIRSLLLAAAALVFYLVVDVHPLIIFLPLVFMNAVMQAFFSPAVISFILDGKKTKTDLLSLRTGTGHLSSLLGQTLGAALYPLYGLFPLLIFNSICFFGSGMSELFLREYPDRQMKHRAETPSGSKLTSIVKEFIELDRRGAPVMLYLGMQAVNSILVLNLPFFLTSRLGFPAEYTGYGLAALLGGSIITGLWLGVSGKGAQVKAGGAFTAAAIFAAICIVSGTLKSGDSSFQVFMVLLVLLAAAGACQGWIYLVTIHHVYSKGGKTNAAIRQGFLEASAAAVLPVGYILSGMIASALPLDTPWLLRGAALLTISLVGGAALHRFIGKRRIKHHLIKG